MKHAPCVVSVAEHAGWAHVVCVAVRHNMPTVVDRGRVTLIDAGLPTQPYHHESLGMKEDEANALIARVRLSIASRASVALERIVTELAPAHAAVALAIRKPPFADLPGTVADAWKSYRLLCAADGMLYQLALCNAARKLEIAVHMCSRGEETSEAAQQLGVTSDEMEHFVSRTGRPPGPPWTQDHRRAYAAGIAALAAYGVGSLRIPTS